METLALPNMPIKIGRIVSSHGSGIYHRYREITEPSDERRSDRLHGVGVGESKRVVEWTIAVPFIIYPVLRRITNVNGQLVKTYLRRPRTTTDPVMR